MSETLQTSFNDVEAQGKIVLFKNHLGKGNSYYGRFDRKTVSTRTLIARIQARKAGTNELNVQEIAGFLKEEILTALRNGEAVNVMDLGTMFISAKGKYDGSGFVTKDGSKPLQVKFTPSRLTQESVGNIQVTDIRTADEGMRIRSVTDRFTGVEDGAASIGKELLLKGVLLRLSDTDGCGVFFCPVGADDNPATDKSLWVKASVITENTSGRLGVYVPEELEEGRRYRVHVRTDYSPRKGKSLGFVREAWSPVVTARK